MLVTDLFLRADDEAAMRAAMAALDLPEGIAAMGVVESQAPQWALLWLGTLYTPAVVDPVAEVIVTPAQPLPGFHANLRWIGDGCPDLSAVALTPEPGNPRFVWG